MSHYKRVAWNPKERVARAADYLDDHFGRHRYGVRFDGDPKIYTPDEVEIPIDLVLAPVNDQRSLEPNKDIP